MDRNVAPSGLYVALVFSVPISYLIGKDEVVANNLNLNLNLLSPPLLSCGDSEIAR